MFNSCIVKKEITLNKTGSWCNVEFVNGDAAFDSDLENIPGNLRKLSLSFEHRISGISFDYASTINAIYFILSGFLH